MSHTSMMCKKGHPQSPDNRIYFPSCPRGRCRICYRAAVDGWRKDNPKRLTLKQRRRKPETVTK